jgi:hypothetical protein
MSKFFLNLLLQIFKALIYSKIKFLFGKEFFLHFRPNRPSGQPAHPAFRPSRGPPPLSPALAHWPAGPVAFGRPIRPFPLLPRVRRHLLLRADRRRRHLACAHAASRRRLRSHNGRSTYSSSLPTTPPGRFPSEMTTFIPLWSTTATARSPPMPGHPAPPPTL